MTRLPTAEFVACVGIDWADAKHAICLEAAGSETREFSVLAHTPETIELQKDAGIAPVTDAAATPPGCTGASSVSPSGDKRSWYGRLSPRSISFWPRAYDQQQRHKDPSPQAAVRALAFKWIRILFRCWQRRTPYDGSVYRNALQRRGSPLMHNFANLV